jgi:1-acyl-sn-glycerol-3-phosphate acyltransferase
MRKLSKWLLNLWGWKTEGEVPEEHKKLLIVEAPHTSNWDYLLGMLAITSIGVKVNVIIKKELFFWPLGLLLKKIGGIPLDRSGKLSKVEALANLFKEKDELNLAITPEGTRALSTKWKRGYYYIAVKAEVPILLTALDYKKKTGIFGKLLYPTGNYDEDFKIIKDFYKGVVAKYPENFNLSEQYLQKKEPGKTQNIS